MKLSRGEMVAHVANIILLVLIIIICIYPVWYVLMYSLSDSSKALNGGLFLWPSGLDFTGYKVVLQQKQIYIAFCNSIGRTAVGTAISLLLNAMLAYPLSLPRLKGRGFFSLAIFFTMLFNGGIIPTYIVVSNLHMIDTFWALVIPGAINAYNLFIMRNFFQSIPSSLEESAMIDGANEAIILFRIILPLSGPVMAAVGMFYGVAYWNAYLDGVLYINSTNLQILQIYLRNLITVAGATAVAQGTPDVIAASRLGPKTLIMVTIVISMIPVLITYPYLQKFYRKGVMVGSIKG